MALARPTAQKAGGGKGPRHVPSPGPSCDLQPGRGRGAEHGSAPALLSAAEDLEEGSAEVSVEGGVDDGVEGAVDVAEPGAGAVQPRGHAAGRAVGIEDVNQEEGQPADYERP